MEGEVPGGEPRVLPRVGHRHDVGGVAVAPVGRCARRGARTAASAAPGRRPASARRRSCRTACSRSCRRRPDASRRAPRACSRPGRQLAVELVGLVLALLHHRLEFRAEPLRRGLRRPRAVGAGADAAPRSRRPRSPAIPRRRLRADAVGVDRRRAMHDVVVDPVLGMRGAARGAEQAGGVGLVVADEDRRQRAVGTRARLQRVAAEPSSSAITSCSCGAQARLDHAVAPVPGVAEPQRRQDVQRVARPARRWSPERASAGRSGRPSRSRPRPPSSGPRRRRRCRAARTRGPASCAPGSSATQILVGERRLGVVVAPAQPRVARQRVEVPPVLLDVLAVVALVAGQPEHPLLEDRVAPVPQGQAEAQPLVDVADRRRARPRSSGRRASGRGRGASTPRRRRRRCSPRARCPRRAR